MAESKMGRPAIWGPRKKHSISFPMPLYEKLSREASAAGMSLTEYVVLELAGSEGVELPDANRNQHELPISA